VNRLLRIWIVTRLTFLEALRRKDVYVYLTLAFMMMVCLGCTRFYGIEGFDRFFREMSILIVNVALAVILVVVTARQFPGDLEGRILFPLLARGVSRVEYGAGKFAGCFIVGVFAVCVLHIKLLLALGLFGVEPGFSLPQALLVRLVTAGVVIGMTFFLSQFLPFRVNVGVSLGVCVLATGGSAAVRFGLEHIGRLAEGAKGVLSVLAPHLGLLDLSPAGAMAGPAAAPVIYGVLYVALFVGGAQYCMGRRKL